MKFIGSKDGKLVVHLEPKERDILVIVLNHYPVIPASYYHLSRKTAPDASQFLLDQALSDQTQENKRLLQSFLTDTSRFQNLQTGCQVTLSADDTEWLLQVLNDIRVGSWIALGSPEGEMWDLDSDDAMRPEAWAVHMAGYFQTHLLEVIDQAVAEGRGGPLT